MGEPHPLRRLGLIALELLALVVIVYLGMRSTVVVPLLAAAILIGIGIQRIGLLGTICAASTIIMGTSATLTRYFPEADVLNSVGAGAFVVAGLMAAPGVRVPNVLRVTGIGFFAVCTLLALAHITLGFEYNARGWIALVAGPLAVVACVGATSQRDSDPPGRGQQIRRVILVCLVVVVVFNLLLGLRQGIFGLTPEETLAAQQSSSTYLVGEEIRLMAGFQTNQDAGLFLTCFPAAFLALGLATRSRMRHLYGITGTLLYVVVFLSLTRTALIASLTMGVVALALFGRSSGLARILRNLGILVVLAGSATAVILLVNIPRVTSAIQRAGSLLTITQDTSYQARRTDTFPLAFSQFLQSPFGAGPGSAGPVSARFPLIAPYGYANADNGYLNLAIQVGLEGLVLAVIMLVALGIWLARGKTALSKAGAIAVGAFLIALLSAGYWNLLGPITVVGVLLGLAIRDRIDQPGVGDVASLDASLNRSLPLSALNGASTNIADNSATRNERAIPPKTAI